MQIRFKDGNRWDLINTLRAGASFDTCYRDKSIYDSRPYGVALLDAYPGIKDNAHGIGTEAATRMLSDGISRGSQPMCVAALLANATTDELNQPEKQRLQRLMHLASVDVDLQKVFEREVAL